MARVIRACVFALALVAATAGVAIVAPAATEEAAAEGCHSAYYPCVPDDGTEWDCSSGGQPLGYSVWLYEITVDPFGLDADDDGWGCENDYGPPAPVPSPTNYSALTPTRILDTRDGTGAPVGKLGAGQTLTVDVITGAGGVPPTTVGAVALNVAVTQAEGTGFLTVFPCDEGRPNAANLNFAAGQTVPNLVLAKVSGAGTVCIYAHTTTHVIADVQGWWPTGVEVNPLTPARILDTRDGTGAAVGKLAAGQTLTLDATGVGGVPAGGVEAVALNVAATQADAQGFLTVYPCDEARPTAANLNFIAGRTSPNLVVAKLSAAGTVCVYAHQGVHVVADTQAWWPSGSSYTPVTPARVLDTRDGTGAAAGKLAAGQTLTLDVTGVGGVPAAGVGAVALNVTATQAGGNGFLTIYPCDEARPTAANLNFTANLTIPNLVVAKTAADGTVCVYAHNDLHVVGDVQGWWPA